MTATIRLSIVLVEESLFVCIREREREGERESNTTNVKNTLFDARTFFESVLFCNSVSSTEQRKIYSFVLRIKKFKVDKM